MERANFCTDVEKDSNCPFEILGEQIVYKGKFVHMKEVYFRLPNTETEQVWDCAMKLKKSGANIHGVHVVADVTKNNRKFILLVKQYRIPLASYCIEFPGGFIEANETVEAAGIRELFEETGYFVDQVVSCSPGRQGLNVGLTDEHVRFLHVKVNGDEARNQNPRPKFDECEQIEVILVPYNQILDRLNHMAVHDDVVIVSEVYTFAMAASLLSPL